jgi:hypothetical protein
MIRRSCHTETALDRASRRPDGAADHRPPGDPRPATLDDRCRARPQPTGHDPPAPPPAGRRLDRGDAVARRPAGRPLRDRATTARTDHSLAGGDRRRTADRPRARRRRPSPPRLTSNRWVPTIVPHVRNYLDWGAGGEVFAMAVRDRTIAVVELAGLGRARGRDRRLQTRLMARRRSNQERPMKTTADRARTPICQLAVVVPRIRRSSRRRMPLVTGMT